MSDYTQILIAIGLSGAAMTVVVMLAARIGVQAYNEQVIASSYTALRDSFVGIDLKRLIVMTVVGTIGLATIGTIAMGLPGGVLGAGVGAIGPKLFQQYRIQQREAEFIYQLPDALRTMSGSLRSGGNIVRAIQQVGQLQPKPVSQEFQLVLQQYQLGRDLDEALFDLEERMKCEELQLLTAAISLSRSVGGNLGDSLDALAQMLQTKAKVEGKIRALTATGRAQSWAMAGLPVVVGIAINLQEPKAMSHLFNEIYGWITLGVIIALMAIGFLIIRKIVDIDV